MEGASMKTLVVALAAGVIAFGPMAGPATAAPPAVRRPRAVATTPADIHDRRLAVNDPFVIAHRHAMATSHRHSTAVCGREPAAHVRVGFAFRLALRTWAPYSRPAKTKLPDRS